jgi:hypothetical protein
VPDAPAVFHRWILRAVPCVPALFSFLGHERRTPGQPLVLNHSLRPVFIGEMKRPSVHRERKQVMAVKPHIVLFDTDQLSALARAMAVACELALTQGIIDSSDAGKERVAKILFALANEGTTDVEALVALTIDALKFGDPNDW